MPEAVVGKPASLSRLSIRSQSRVVEPAERDRCPRRERHADADGFAVQPALVAADGLERVAEGVAQVQQRAAALLAFVLGDDGGLDLAAAPNRVGQRRGVEAPQVVDVALEPREERGVDDDAVLDDLGEPGSRARAAATMRSVPVSAKHRDRLVEGADHVFRARMVHGGLAADRRVDLREQRRRHLHEIDAALIARCRRSPSGRRRRRRPSATRQQSRWKRPSMRRSITVVNVARVLCRSPSGRTRVSSSRPRKAACTRCKVQRRDDLVGDDRGSAWPSGHRGRVGRASPARRGWGSCAHRVRRRWCPRAAGSQVELGFATRCASRC